MMKSGGMRGAGEETTPKSGRGMRKKMIKFTDVDKENFSIYGGGNVLLRENKSPLPVGYPRLPLQDITAVLQPQNSNDSNKEEPDTETLKPVTRSQGPRKLRNMHKTVLFERNSGSSSQVGSSKVRKQQVVKIVVAEEIKTILQMGGDVVQTKEETIHLTSSLSTSVQVSEQPLGGQKIQAEPSAAEKTPEEIHKSGRAGEGATTDKEKGMEATPLTLAEQEGCREPLEKPKCSSMKSSSGKKSEKRRRKLPTTRSRVLSFR